jgi:hypothetical protein
VIRENAAIMWTTSDAGDGHPSMGYGAAKVQCANCDGWEGTSCPHDCGVRLVSIAAEKDAECMERLRREHAERQRRRAARKAERAAAR